MTRYLTLKLYLLLYNTRLTSLSAGQPRVHLARHEVGVDVASKDMDLNPDYSSAVAHRCSAQIGQFLAALDNLGPF